MATLIGKHINLRALEPTDLDFLFSIENNENFWKISNTQIPYSKYILANYINNAHQDIYEAKQYRFVICNTENIPVGTIDLFDFDPQHFKVGVGILILPKYQHNNIGSEALELVIDYAFTYLNIHQIFANITSNNIKSIALFEKFNFQKTGEKKDWLFINGEFKNELLYQLIKS
ncbi:GNAT family protein [Lutibacter sp. TH_r2]|uniref:GNAT family N-acetyltransferase n=1 Tax=Lutibacter sp. TH_r2 TaxID=3082083 RepID=UPI002954FF73|nr:GNAT family protein [Lutibacter sp. TH_r2]MDV7188512.1 GNAT family protein [Lutibacter sp. TH_r2]